MTRSIISQMMQMQNDEAARAVARERHRQAYARSRRRRFLGIPSPAIARINARINAGAATLNSLPLVRDNGEPLRAGDLIAGEAYEVDRATGRVNKRETRA